MTRGRFYEVSAVVIRQREAGGADRVVTLFTRERGKLSAVARGVRKPHSRLAPVLQLFNRARLRLVEGRSLDVVAGAQLEESLPTLREHPDRYLTACYLAELTEAMTEETAPAEWVYDLLVATLAGIASGGEAATLARGFELKLLSGLGYGPELEVCVGCGAEVGTRAGGFSAAEGGIMCGRCAAEGVSRLSSVVLQAMRELAALPQEELAGRRLRASVREELERLVKQFVEYRLDHPLRSAAFLPR